MKIKQKLHSVLLVVGVAVLFGAVQCKKAEAPNKAFSGLFTFTKGEVLKNGMPARAGEKVLGADKIEVKDKSAAVIQFAADAQLTLSANSVVTLDELSKGSDGKAKINVNQQSGTTFSKVLAKGSDYKVSSPTLVAGVRGTSFSLTIDRENPKRVMIKLLEGKVQATSTDVEKAGEPVVIEAGQKIEASEASIAPVEKLSPVETTSLEQLNQTAMVNSADLASMESTSVAETVETPVDMISTEVVDQLASGKPVPVSEAKEAEVAKKQLTLQDLKNRYGRLSKVVTKDGKEYIGSFSQDNVTQTMVITTVNGSVKIKVNQIAKVSAFQD